MGSGLKEPRVGYMDKAQPDLVESYKLDTEFFPEHVIHTKYAEKANRRNMKVKEDWSNCGELGRGGSGVVYKQTQKSTGNYRAVKTIDKRLPLNREYSRELLIMAKLKKVCVLTLEEFCPSLLPLGDFPAQV